MPNVCMSIGIHYCLMELFQPISSLLQYNYMHSVVQTGYWASVAQTKLQHKICTLIPTAEMCVYTNSLDPAQLYLHIRIHVYTYLPRMFMVSFFSASIRLPSWHTTSVPLRSAVALTVVVDVMDVPVTTSVTVNWNGGSESTSALSAGVRDREMPSDGTTHRCRVDWIAHVNTTFSPGHGLSTLDCNSAPET